MAACFGSRYRNALLLFVACIAVRSSGETGTEPNTMGTTCTHLWNSACPGPKAAEQLAALVPEHAESSQAQRLAIAQLSLKALVDNIPGDFIDIGAGIGGAAAAVMVKALSAHDDETRVSSRDTKADERGGSRQVWVVDPFSGGPNTPWLSSTINRGYIVHGLSPKLGKSYSGATINGLCDVLRRTGTLDFFRLRLVAGNYNVTLPRMPLTNGDSGSRIALLRIGPGLACTTLHHMLSTLYPRISPGAIIYVDGYPYNGCNLESFHRGGLQSLVPVVEDDGMHYSAVWWAFHDPQKNGTLNMDALVGHASGRRRLRTDRPRIRR